MNSESGQEILRADALDILKAQIRQLLRDAPGGQLSGTELLRQLAQSGRVAFDRPPEEVAAGLEWDAETVIERGSAYGPGSEG